MSLRPPSSPSPSPGPHENGRNANSRQSLGSSTRSGGGLNMAPGSPRPGARPTSELVVPSSAMYQTPEAEALDQWFENLQNYEATLEEMAAASLDVNFKEELSAIEQWFKVLSEAERTAALYSLLQHSTQVQIRFFITVLQQMARSDPMTALLSPAMGGSMQSQMDAKLASLKTPGMGLPGSPTARNFGGAGNRGSLVLDNSNANYLSPDSAAIAGAPPSAKEDAAATLAQQRAKFKASNAAHRISAPVLSSGADPRNAWGNQLSQVAEANANNNNAGSNAGSTDGTNSRPKSTEFSGSNARPAAAANSGGEGGGQTITAENSWASMVNTPLIPMFQQKEGRVSHLDAASKKLNDWRDKSGSGGQQQPVPGPPGVPRMGDPTIHRRKAPNNSDHHTGGVYDENGNLVRGGGAFGGGRGNQGGTGWGPARSPVLGGNNNNRFGGLSDDGRGGAGNMGMGGMGGMPNMGAAMASPNALAGMMGMNPLTSPFGVNMQMLGAMGLSPEAQLLAAQMAAAQAGWLGMNQPGSAGIRGAPGLGRPPHSGRSTGGFKSPGSIASSGIGGGSTPKDAEDVDPNVLNDIPTWLRSLRLHKYTPNFEGMKWQDMVIMDEEALEKKGVAALGARRKMMKTFELVRKKMGIEGGPPSLPPSATILSA